MVTVTGAPAPASQPASQDRRAGPAAASRAAVPRTEASRQAGQRVRATSSTTMITAPADSTSQSALTPGSGSASRAAPIGISGEAATATPAARIAPAVPATAISISAAASSWPRVMPSAASTGLSAPARSSSRVAAWPTISSAVQASTSAKMASAMASGRIPRSIVATCVLSSDT